MNVKALLHHRLGRFQSAEALEWAAPPPVSCLLRINQILRLAAGSGIAGLDLLKPLEVCVPRDFDSSCNPLIHFR